MHEIPLLIDMGASKARRCGEYLLPAGIRFYEASIEWLANLGRFKTTGWVGFVSLGVLLRGGVSFPLTSGKAIKGPSPYPLPSS